MAGLREKYLNETVTRLTEAYGYRNIMEVPRLTKVVINVGVGKEASSNPKVVETVQEDLAAIAGQHPVITRSKRSIANFKLREGMPVGLKVTLRGNNMYNFLDKLISVVLPRLRDFQGVPQDAFDGRGNYALGLKEHSVFPEIDFSKIDKIRGLEVCIVTTAKTDAESRTLLEGIGMPFAKE
ncbi:ribosomal protein L5 [Dehalogenimonas lykanthroporepellens BL-DC-9]|nr:ribosomal protein L5 [Dehalogenimonas lykanthroporepellens BL-DC-9]